MLARSVIRRRYPRDGASEVVPELPSTTLLFYCNDEHTPLADPSPTDNGAMDVDSTAFDVVEGAVAELRALLSLPSSGERSQLPGSFEDGIIEVYGPPLKRPRFIRSSNRKFTPLNR